LTEDQNYLKEVRKKRFTQKGKKKLGHPAPAFSRKGAFRRPQAVNPAEFARKANVRRKVVLLIKNLISGTGKRERPKPHGALKMGTIIPEGIVQRKGTTQDHKN